MSEHDNEFRGMTESIDDKIRRAHAEEMAEASRAAFLRRHRWAIRIGGAVAAACLAGAAGFGFVKLSHEAQSENGEQVALTSVEGLRAHGACADELTAESKLVSFSVVFANNTFNANSKQAEAARYQRAASLAAKYSVSCLPAKFGASNLTPDFDIGAMERNRQCSNELLAQRINPEVAMNDAAKHLLQYQNKKFGLAAQLADKYKISC